MTLLLSEKRIREHVQKIIDSDEFNTSPRNQNFLKYIVEKTLAGEENLLKGYTIGVDVFDRGDDFDPQADTIVRVQARNLRKALELYYLTSGTSDEIRIDLTKGSYVPAFSVAEPQDPVTDEAQPADNNVVAQPKPGRNNRRRRNYMIGLIILSSVAIVSVFFTMRYLKPDGFEMAATMPAGPSISVLPFDIIGDDARYVGGMWIQNLRTGLHIETAGKISRFKNLTVKEVRNETGLTPIESARAAGTEYVLTGSFQAVGDDIRITSLLTRTSNGDVVWTETYDVDTRRGVSLLETQSEIAIDVATSLGQPTGSVNSKFIVEQSMLDDIQLEHYCCLMQFYVYTNIRSKQEHLRTRTCLEKATTEMPRYSSAWAALSWMYSDEWNNQFNVRDDDAPARERSLEAARRAVAADPDNAMAHQYLATAEYFMGNETAFLEAAETALRLNPNDAEVLAHIGTHLLQLENSDRGRDMVEKAMKLNPAHPTWYHSAISMYYYTRNDTAKALYHANQYFENGSLAAHSLLTAALVQDGQIDEAKQVFSVLLEKYPAVEERYEEILKSRRLPTGLYEQMISDLAVAGLPIDK